MTSFRKPANLIRSENRQKIAPIAFVALVIFLLVSAYSNTFSSPPVLDDLHSFVFEENVHIRDLSASSLAALSKTVFGWKRWIPMVSFSLDLWFGKGEIFSFHLTNLLIHIFSMLAVLFLGYNVLQIENENGRTYAIPPIFYALWAAGLWALNPVQTNGVTYLVQRMASLQAFFFITSVAFYVLGRRKHRRQQRMVEALPCYMGCLLAAVCAFLSKENSAMLPVMLLVTEVWFFTPELHRSAWKRLKGAPWVTWGLLLVGVLVGFLGGAKIIQGMMLGYGIRHFTLVERLLTEARVVVWYLSLFLWPLPSRLSLEHDVVISFSLLHPASTLGAITFLALLGWLVLRYRKKYPLYTYGGMWFFLNLLIESSIVPLELIFEHRLYLPSVGLALVSVGPLGSVFSYLLANRSTKDFVIVSSCGFVLLCSGLSLLTFVRNEAWRDGITIYQDAAQKAPKHPRGHANLAVAYAEAGLYGDAIREAEYAHALGREYHEASFIAGNVILGSLIGLGKYEEAIERGGVLLENRPEYVDTGGLIPFHLNLVQAHLKLGQLSQAYTVAMRAFKFAQQKTRTAHEIRQIENILFAILSSAADRQLDLNLDGADDPGELPMKTWLAKEFLDRGEREEARYLLIMAAREVPDDMETARLLEGIRKEDELNYVQITKQTIDHKYQSYPFSRFNACMALAYLARTPSRSATLRNLGERLLDYALEIQPGAADAHLLKGYYLHDRKDIESAIQSTQRALALDPDYAKAWLALGYFRMELNEFPAAANAFRRGLELYPGCPQRQSVLAVITAIEQNPALATAQN